MSGELIIEGESPPSEVMDDLQAVRSRVKVRRIRIEAGPDSGWTMSVMDETDEEKFNTIADLVEDSVSGSDDVRRVYDRRSSEEWIVQVRY